MDWNFMIVWTFLNRCNRSSYRAFQTIKLNNFLQKDEYPRTFKNFCFKFRDIPISKQIVFDNFDSLIFKFGRNRRRAANFIGFKIFRKIDFIAWISWHFLEWLKICTRIKIMQTFKVVKSKIENAYQVFLCETAKID